MVGTALAGTHPFELRFEVEGPKNGVMKMHSKFLLSAATGALLAMTGAAFAQSTVVATTDLNVRAGPGPRHQVIGVLGAGQSVTLDGCIQGSRWCVVAFDGGQGWVYSDYL